MKTHEKPSVISAATVMQVRHATGMGIVDAKRFLEEASPLLYSRFIEAVLSGKRKYTGLYDPLEDEPELAAIFKAAERETEEEMRIREEEFYRSSPATVHFV